MTVIENLDTVFDEIAALREEYHSRIRSLGSECLLSLVEGAPDELIALTWTTWIPSFNDGEPCEFSMSEPMLTFSKRPLSKYEDPEDDIPNPFEEGFSEDTCVSIHRNVDYRDASGNRISKWSYDPDAGHKKIVGELTAWGFEPEQVAEMVGPNTSWIDRVETVSEMEDLFERLVGANTIVHIRRLDANSPWFVEMDEYDCGY